MASKNLVMAWSHIGSYVVVEIRGIASDVITANFCIIPYMYHQCSKTSNWCACIQNLYGEAIQWPCFKVWNMHFIFSFRWYIWIFNMPWPVATYMKGMLRYVARAGSLLHYYHGKLPFYLPRWCTLLVWCIILQRKCNSSIVSIYPAL